MSKIKKLDKNAHQQWSKGPASLSSSNVKNNYVEQFFCAVNNYLQFLILSNRMWN